MKDSTRKRILFLFVLVGLMIINYPFVSQWVNKGSESRVINNYESIVQNMTEDEKAEIITLANEYNQRLAQSQTGITDAFSTAYKADEEYNGLLNPGGDGIMGYISIPKIDVNIPIYHGTSASVLESGAGHLYGSSLPVGGESTHAILSSHSGLPSKELFTNLDQLDTTDYFYIKVMGETLEYRIDSIETVLPNETESLVIKQGEDLVTLVTCTPYGVNSHRLLVTGHRVYSVEGEGEENTPEHIEEGISGVLKIIFIISIIVLILAGKILLFPCRKRERRKQ